jgi:hypothetical protein
MYDLRTRLLSHALRPFTKTRLNEPYISQAFFRSLGEYVISDLRNLTPSVLQEVRNARVLYIYSTSLAEFLEVYGRRISAQCIFAGSTDLDFTDEGCLRLRSDKTLFLQNSYISDNDRIFTLPIGIEDYSKALNGLKTLMKPKFNLDTKLPKLLVGPFSQTHPERQECIETLSGQENVITYNNLCSPREFAKLSSVHAFIASPRGNGRDTHRIWESIYRRSVPVTLQDSWSESLMLYQLPIELLGKWSDWNSVTPLVRLKRFRGGEVSPVLWTSFWRNLIACLTSSNQSARKTIERLLA